MNPSRRAFSGAGEREGFFALQNNPLPWEFSSSHKEILTTLELFLILTSNLIRPPDPSLSRQSLFSSLGCKTFWEGKGLHAWRPHFARRHRPR